VAITVEGANILTRSLIIFGQGAIRCHPWLLQEIAAANDTDENRAIAAFDRAFFSHVGRVITNVSRSFVKNATGGLLGSDPSVGEANYWFAQLERASASFAVAAELALLQLGGELKRKEKLSGRFADILGEMYLMSCALKRFEDDGRPDVDLPVIEFAFQNAMFKIQQDLDEIIENLPIRSTAWLLRLVIFPWGRRWRPASDKLGGKVSDLLVMSSTFRERLCAGMYFDDSPEDNLGCLEHAVRLAAISESAENKVRNALRDGAISMHAKDAIGAALAAGIIAEAEAGQLRATAAALRRAIDVDDFDAAELWPAAATPQRTADAA
jgi:acyl-CoA dehydrogenase